MAAFFALNLQVGAEEKKEAGAEPAKVESGPPPTEQKIQIPADTQKKIDEMLDTEAARRAEESKKAREPKKATPPRARVAEDKAGGTGLRPGVIKPGVEGDVSMSPDLGPGLSLNIAPSEPNPESRPAEERQYQFSIKDGTYKQLIEGVARQTGLGVLGEAPDGKVTFVTDRVLNFTEMLSQVRMLLFNFKPHEPYWLKRYKDRLEVRRVNDLYRELDESQMFLTVEAFRQAGLSPEELALLVFTPSGSMSRLREVRNFLPDYVRVNPMEGQNSVTIFALVRDIEKYLRLEKFFSGGESDPRPLKTYKVENVAASDAVAKLQAFMELDKPKIGGAPRSGNRNEPNPLDNMPEPDVDMFPDDPGKRLMIRAVEEKHKEVAALLLLIDAAPSVQAGLSPVILELQFADAAEMVATIQQILTANPTAAMAPSPMKKKGKGAAAAPAIPSAPVRLDDIILIPHPSGHAIIVLAEEVEVERIRGLIAMFDVANKVGPMRISLVHGDATEVVLGVVAVLWGEAPPPDIHLVAGRNGDTIWYSGGEKELAKIKSVIAELDVAPAKVSLHSARLIHQKAEFVASMLRAYDTGEPVPTGAEPLKKRRGKSVGAVPKQVDPSKFTANEETNLIFVMCTDAEWSEYLKLIEQLERLAITGDAPFETLKLVNLSSEAAIEKLTALFGTEEYAKIRYAPIDGGIMVMDADADVLGRMAAVLGGLDTPPEVVVERTFEIRYADPSEIEAAIHALLGDGGSDAPRTTKRKTKGVEEKSVVNLSTAEGSTAGLKIVRLGDRLVVKTSAVLMDHVAALVKEFDVDTEKTELRVYSDFPAGADIDGIASTMQSVFGGSASSVVAEKERPKARVSTNSDGPKFMPQAGAGKLLVVAEPALFPRIEDLLVVLRQAAEKEFDPIRTRFIDVKHADPDEIVERISPLLDLKISGLIDTGELIDPGTEAIAAPMGKKGRGKPAQRSERYHLEPDVRNRRVVIAAPQRIIDEATSLIAEWDKPSASPTDSVVQTVTLKNADASEMVRAIRELMGATPMVKSKGGKKSSAAATAPDAPTEAPLTITEVPGGKAVVLRGSPVDVEQAIGWIDKLEAQSFSGRSIKVYKIHTADISELADLIMNIVDISDRPSPGIRASRPSSSPKKGTSKSKSDDEDAETEDPRASGTRVGQEVFVRTDTISKTMIVAASPAKIAQIDNLVAQFDRPAGEGTVVLSAPPPLPKFTYDLKHKSAFDAKWDLELMLEAVWDNPKDQPKVDDSPISETLIVRHWDETKFDQIRELIAKHVDLPDKEDAEPTRKPVPLPSGVTADEFAAWLRSRHSNVLIERVGEPVEEPDYGIEKISPPKKSARPGSEKPETNKPIGMLPIQQAWAAAVLTMGAEDPPEEGEEAEDVQFDPEHSDNMLIGAALQMQAMQDAAGGGKKSDSTKDDKDAKKMTGNLGPVKVYIDPSREDVVIDGPKAVVKEIEDLIEEFEKEREKIPESPDIRIYRVRYIDLNTAKEIIEEMFNTPRQQQQQMQQMNVLQQRMAAQAAAAAGRQQGAQPGKQDAGGGKGQDQNGQGGQQNANPRGMPNPNLAALAMPQASPSSVRVIANPRDRSLILRANKTQYPDILELLATIDQPRPVESELKVFVLEKLNAADVEAQLKELLGLDQASASSRRRATASISGVPGGAESSSLSPSAMLPRDIQAETMTGSLPLSIDPKDIKLSSNEEANAIMVLAPKEGIKYIGKLIEDLENQKLPERITKHYALVHCNVEDVTDYLTSQFSDARSVVRGRRKGVAANSAAAGESQSTSRGAGNSPTFVAYPRLNLLSIQATKEQITEIDALIARLDVKAVEEAWQTVQLAHADAKVIADTLSAMFSGGSARAPRSPSSPASSTSEPKFIGQEGGRLVFYTAPEALRSQIEDAVAKLEEQSKSVGQVRVITLVHALASDVADAIEAAYGGGRRSGSASSRATRNASAGGAGGGSTAGARFSVTPSDATKRLFVVADDEMFAQIESLSELLDVQRDVGFEFRIYRMQHANARSVYTTLTKLVTDFLRMNAGKGDVEPFSVDVDDRANALVVLGGPVVFGFVEKALTTVDTPSNAASPPGFLMMPLKNADAAEVAGNITRLWAQRTPQQGEAAPQVEANKAINAIIVRGTQAQLDEIKKQFIDPLEGQMVASLRSETIKLQHAQAEVVSESINRIFDDKKRVVQAAGPGSPVRPIDLAVIVTPEVVTNQIIVQANDANMTLVKERVAELDRPEVAMQTSTSTQTYSIRFADASSVANIITQWSRARITPGPTGKIAPKDVVVALAELTTQSVVVTASEANHKLIKQMLHDVDSNANVVEQQARVINLHNADAEAMARTLVEIFVRAAPRPVGTNQAPPISIAALPGSRALLVKCKLEDFEKIEEVVKQLDQEESASGGEVRVVPILYGDATEMKTALEEYLRKPGAAAGRTGGLTGDVRVSVLTQGNAMVISGEKTEVDRLELTVRTLDIAGEKGSVPQLIVLKHANVVQVIPTLQEMFGAASGGQRRNQPPPVIVASETNNAIMVRAGATDFTAIQSAVAQLDTPEAASKKPYRMISVSPGINLANLANEVEDAVNESAKAQSPASGRGTRQAPAVSVTPDARTSSLLVSGSQTLFDQVEAIVREREKMAPAGGMTTRVIRPSNVTPEEIDALIRQMTDQERNNSGGARRPRSGTTGNRPSTPSRPRGRSPDE